MHKEKKWARIDLNSRVYQCLVTLYIGGAEWLAIKLCSISLSMVVLSHQIFVI